MIVLLNSGVWLFGDVTESVYPSELYIYLEWEPVSKKWQMEEIAAQWQSLFIVFVCAANTKCAKNLCFYFVVKNNITILKGISKKNFYCLMRKNYV